MDELAPRVAERHARSQAKLDTSLRREINRDLTRAGLDGNGRWQKPGLALGDAFKVLAEHGLEPDEIANSHALGRPEGTLSVRVAFSNSLDPFSPESIHNSVLHFSWTELRKYHVEVVAYMS